jgi:hypothetical protein
MNLEPGTECTVYKFINSTNISKELVGRILLPIKTGGRLAVESNDGTFLTSVIKTTFFTKSAVFIYTRNSIYKLEIRNDTIN